MIVPAMQTRALGSLQASVVGLGCNNFGWRIDAAATARVVHAALDVGVTCFDTAELYGDGQSEEYLAAALGRERQRVIIATKFGYRGGHPARGGSADNIRRAVEGSLRRLHTDYIDLYQIHSPDPAVPIAETLGALNVLVQEGKVREIGCSNFTAAMLDEAAAAVEPDAARFVSVQNKYSLFERGAEEDALPRCEPLGMGFLPYYPLADGLLTGKYRRGDPIPDESRIAAWRNGVIAPETLDRVEALIAFAATRGHTILELAFAWVLTRPAVSSVIAGATSAAQVRANAVAAAWQLNEDDLRSIDTIVSTQRTA
jgi:aryl-alcohol dehydrogenase-like predicted oxidoreductase